jgi:hypothetical protein
MLKEPRATDRRLAEARVVPRPRIHPVAYRGVGVLSAAGQTVLASMSCESECC